MRIYFLIKNKSFISNFSMYIFQIKKKNPNSLILTHIDLKADPGHTQKSAVHEHSQTSPITHIG
jgi:hypothetical protein